jgi:polygalacturonase
MKHRSLLLALCLCVALWSTARATDYTSYYEQLPVAVAQPELPQVPERTVRLTDFGAKGDGLTLNTDAFRQAIASLSAQGGGHLIVPDGIWLTGPIVLQNHIDLHLEQNAMILFSTDKRLYVDSTGTSRRFLPGISAQRVTDISITGSGIIDGGGAAWRPVKKGKVSDVEWKRYVEAGAVLRQEGQLLYPWQMKSGYADVYDTPEEQESRRNDLFRINNCERVLLSGVTFQNSPKFHVHPMNCRSVVMDGITVRCPWNAQNGDAIDLSDCHRALVVRCTVDAGDDGLCLKSGNASKGALVNGCEDIVLADNTVFHAHGGFVIGSESVCGMRRIVVQRCRFSGTETGLRFKSSVGRGGQSQDLYIRDIVMNDIVGEGIVFQCNYEDRKAGATSVAAPTTIDRVPDFTDIHISNVTCVGAKVAIAASGIAGLNCVHGIEINDATFVYTQKATAIDTATAQLSLENVRFVPFRADSWPVE